MAAIHIYCNQQLDTRNWDKLDARRNLDIMIMESVPRESTAGYHRFRYMYQRGRASKEIIVQANKRVPLFNY